MISWLWYTTVIAAAGAAGAAGVLAGVPGAAADAWRRRTARTAVIVTALLACTVAARLWSQTWQAFGGDQPLTWLLVRVIVTETPWGSGWTWQALGALLCLLSALAMRHRGDRWPLLLAVALPTAFATALTGHAVGMDDDVWITILAHGVHVVAAGLWLGTLGMLLVVSAGDKAEGTAPFAAAIARFSRMAVPAVTCLVVAGLVATWRHVGTIENLQTDYGFVLGAKSAAFLLAGACGFYNWRVRTRRGVAWLEILFGLIAVALTAVLGTLSMPGHDH